VTAFALGRFNGVVVATPHGDIDAANAAAIHEELASCLTPEATGLVVDLSQTRYLDSAGVDMLFRLGERLRQRRTALRVVVPPDSQLRRLLELVHMAGSVPIYQSVDDAIADVPPGPSAPDAGETKARDLAD
jgi:anti-sigma B factor antagonist